MRTFFLFLLILLPVAALLILNYFISLEFARIAEARGTLPGAISTSASGWGSSAS